MPGAGEHDRLITIKRDAGTTRDTDGAEIPAAVIVASAWAKRIPIGGSEGETGEGRVATTSYRWELRHYLPGITATKMWVDERGVQHDILQALEVGRRAGLHLITKQRGT